MPDSDSWLRNQPTRRSISSLDAEICVNCWYFVDSTGIVLRLAARPYALTGTDAEKLAVLKSLSGTDHLTALQAKVPSKYVLKVEGGEFQGAIPASAIEMNPVPVFDELFQEISDSLPDLIRSVDDNYERFRMQLSEPFLWVSTAVYESSDGSLVARVSG